METKIATFGAGCFWHVEEAFRQIKGVKKTSVGYSGGRLENPTYEEVCSHQTGHAEVVRVEFDPTIVSYEQLLDIFWKIHDPTQLNRQGFDVGSQYRSVVFFHSSEQERSARKSKEAVDASGVFGNQKVVTEILPAVSFYEAEEFHQQYLLKRGRSYC